MENITTVYNSGRICGDCVQAIANDDYTALDYYYGEGADLRMEEIQKGIRSLSGSMGDFHQDNTGQVVTSSILVVGNEAGFSRSSCSCCGTDLAGDRHESAVIVNSIKKEAE